MSYTLKKSVKIHAPQWEVWKALTDPAIIKEYFFGVQAESNWKEGSTIIYKGNWEGKPYSAKGKILQMEPPVLLRHSYRSDLSALPDRPENYHVISYELEDLDGNTMLHLTEENLQDEKMREQSSRLWDNVFEQLKDFLTGQKVGDKRET